MIKYTVTIEYILYFKSMGPQWATWYYDYEYTIKQIQKNNTEGRERIAWLT